MVELREAHSEQALLRKQQADLQQEQSRLTQQPPSLSGGSGTPTISDQNLPNNIVASLTLRPGLVRGGGAGNTLSVPRNARPVRLEIFPDNIGEEPVMVSLETAEGGHVWPVAARRNAWSLMAVFLFFI